MAKHAQAKHVGVVATRRDGFASLFVEDDGRGFDPESAAVKESKRLGLVGMRERVLLAGGTLEIESSPGKGTVIYVRIPLPEGREPIDGRPGNTPAGKP